MRILKRSQILFYATYHYERQILSERQPPFQASSYIE